MSYRILPTLFLLMHFLCASAQSPLIINEEGLPPIHHYPSSQYGGNDQVWDIIQDDRGLIYVTTTSSLNEYDGEDWRAIPISPGQIGTSFSKSSSGRIYVSGYNMLGYLATDSLGATAFVSLEDKLPPDFSLGIPGYNQALGDQIIFSSTESIMIFDESDNSFRSFITNTPSNISFFIKGEPLFMLKGLGLVQWEDDTLGYAENGAFFKDIITSGVVNISDTSAVISTYFQGFYYYAPDTVYRIEALSDPFFTTKYPRSIFKIGKEYLGVSFLQGGLVVLNSAFQPILQLDKRNGLTNEAYGAYLDVDYNLWMGSNNGLYRIDFASAFTQIDERLGLEGNIVDVAVTNGKIYAAGSQGIFSRPLQPNAPVDGEIVPDRSFEKVKNSQLYTDWLLTGKDPILVKCGGSVGQIRNDQFEVVIDLQTDQGYAITFLKDSTYAIAAGKSGQIIELLRHQPTGWIHERTIEYKELPDIIYRFLYDAKSERVWGCNNEELFSFNLSEDYTEIVDFILYDEAQGISSNDQININLLGDEVVFPTMKDGLYMYNVDEGRFEKNELFGSVFDTLGLINISRQSSEVYWVSTDNYVKGKVTIADGKPKAELGATNVIPGNNAWIRYVDGIGASLAGSTGLYVIPPSKKERTHFTFPPQVRKMILTNDEDTVVYFGNKYNSLISLKPSQNAIRFEVAVPYYRHPDFIEYSYKLEPFDETWSEWTSLNQKEYTNLPSGDYTLFIKSKNGFLETSQLGEYAFKIMKPWYRSIFVYLMIVILFGLVVYFIVYWNSRRLKRENERLEAIIEDRTKEILDQKNIIEKSLVEREALLKEIHHRVKNNLQIIASLLYLQSGKFENEDFKKVLEEGQGRVRSMALIHQKLYENEDLKSIPFQEYLNELLREIRASFGTENVKLNIVAENIQFDVETAVPLGLIVNELATNAFKYAFEGLEQGTFSIMLKKEGDQYHLTVSDDGKGIPEGIDIRKTKSLGLRLVKMLSVQLEGEYEFQTENGTVFKMNFAA